MVESGKQQMVFVFLGAQASLAPTLVNTLRIAHLRIAYMVGNPGGQIWVNLSSVLPTCIMYCMCSNIWSWIVKQKAVDENYLSSSLIINVFTSCLICWTVSFQNWLDYQLNWNTSEYGGVSSIRVHPKLIWTPDLLMYNRYTIMTHVQQVHNNDSCTTGTQ